eukprot:3849495-Rhodomonas_salina.1
MAMLLPGVQPALHFNCAKFVLAACAPGTKHPREASSAYALSAMVLRAVSYDATRLMVCCYALSSTEPGYAATRRPRHAVFLLYQHLQGPAVHSVLSSPCLVQIVLQKRVRDFDCAGKYLVQHVRVSPYAPGTRGPGTEGGLVLREGLVVPGSGAEKKWIKAISNCPHPPCGQDNPFPARLFPG